MQIVSLGDNLHGMAMPIFWKNKKNIVKLSSASRVVKINFTKCLMDENNITEEKYICKLICEENLFS